jgi:negative regulator of sigma E activity
MSEKLSSLLDGELAADEFELSYREVVSDDDMLRRVTRYQLIGSYMRNDGSAAACHIARSSVAEKISARIDQEPQWLLPTQMEQKPSTTVSTSNATAETVSLDAVRQSRRPAFFGGFAVAAAISALAVFVLSPNILNNTVLPPQQLASTTAPVEKAVPMSADNLNALLVEHGEFSGSAGINGLIAYAKFVSHDSQ